MKITKQQLIKFKHYKLLKLKLINTKIYKNKFEHRSIEKIENTLKKALHVIYKYHLNNKRILFIGTPVHLNKKINFIFHNTKHIIIPESTWINGMINNQSLYLKYLYTKNTQISKLILKLRKKSDLIVILNEEKNFNALNEGHKAKIPTISLNTKLSFIINKKRTYSISGNFNFTQKQIRNNFFYFLLKSIFKKAIKNRNK